MHILVIPSAYPSPSNRVQGCFVREQALALSESGLQVGVVAAELHRLRGLNPRTLFEVDDGWTQDGAVHCLHQSQVGVPGTWRSVRARQFSALARKLAKQYRSRFGTPDILHAHGVLNAGLFAARLHEQWGVPHVLTLHSSRWLHQPEGEYVRLLKEAIFSADQVVAVSDALAEAVCRLSGFERQKIHVIGNLIGTGHPGVQPRTKAITRWVSVAALLPTKGHDELIRAFAAAFSDKSEFTLRIIGEGPERPKLERLIEQSGLQNQVTLVGQLSSERVFEELGGADAFVLATQFETFGVAILEALGAGLPVVTTRCGGPEGIVNEGDGLLVPPNDRKALTLALSQCVALEASWDREAISRRAFEQFGAGRISARLTSLYKETVTP